MSEAQKRLEAFKKEVLKDAIVTDDNGYEVTVAEGSVLDFSRYELCYNRSRKSVLTRLAAEIFTASMPEKQKIQVIDIIGSLIKTL